MITFQTRIFLILSISLVLSGCVTYEYHETTFTQSDRLSAEDEEMILEEELLDVGIVLFNDGIDELGEDEVGFSSVRQSESVWFASHLKAALDFSNAWGNIRTLPNDGSVFDVQVSGKILESNGEYTRLNIEVKDATGSLWFAKDYDQRASSYSYNPEVNSNLDPFHSLFVNVANDMFDHRASLTVEQRIGIRSLSKVLFAQQIIPDAFDGYVAEEEGLRSLLRTPAQNDPTIQRIERLRARNDLFLDVIQDYYRGFNSQMVHPYQEWRKATYKKVVTERQLKAKSRQEKIGGAVAIAAGLLAQTSNSRYTRLGGHVGMYYGAGLFRFGYQTEIEAEMVASELRELSNSLEMELEPSIIDLQERSVTLTGTVDDQFREWKNILRQMYSAEIGEEYEAPENLVAENLQAGVDRIEVSDASVDESVVQEDSRSSE